MLQDSSSKGKLDKMSQKGGAVRSIKAYPNLTAACNDLNSNSDVNAVIADSLELKYCQGALSSAAV